METSPQADYMRMALDAARGVGHRTSPNPVVGCIIVKEGEVVGTGITQPVGQAHAEVMALRDAGPAARGADMYVTLEPCSMCAGALVNSRVSRLVYGCTDRKAGAVHSLYEIPTDIRLNHRLEVTGGCRAEECSALLTAFFRGRRQEIARQRAKERRGGRVVEGA